MKRTTTIIVTLTFEHDESADAYDIEDCVDDFLDAGTQDAIVEIAADKGHTITITNAFCYPDTDAPVNAHKDSEIGGES